jgi:hypothetical protein
LVIDTRSCEQCGAAFAPRREHARFCSARCRVAWNRENTADRSAENTADRSVEVSALDWSTTAMRDATARLLRARAWDRARAFAVITEAVWWVTIVDATLVRYHPATYDRVLAGQPAGERERTEGTLAGLRFVRNWMGPHLDPADFIQPGGSHSGPVEGRITAWTWKPVPKPALGCLPARGQAWELTRHRAYETQLAGRTIGEPFGRAAAFLKLAAAQASIDLEVSAEGGHEPGASPASVAWSPAFELDGFSARAGQRP